MPGIMVLLADMYSLYSQIMSHATQSVPNKCIVFPFLLYVLFGDEKGRLTGALGSEVS